MFRSTAEGIGGAEVKVQTGDCEPGFMLGLFPYL